VSQNPFGDIPLFREIQRILASDQGPVNYEIARQVAGTIATQKEDPSPTPEAKQELADAVRSSEQLLVGYTRIQLDEPLRVALMGRATWVLESLNGWKWLFDALAVRLTEGMAPGAAGEGAEESDPMATVMKQITPLLMGIQTGTLVGHLANEALGRYDLPIPREDDGSLFFVTPNISALADEYQVGVSAFHKWLALNESARHLVAMSRPWTIKYFRSLIVELTAAIEIDMSDLERRLIELQSGSMEALQEGIGGEHFMPLVPNERHRMASQRLRSFNAIFDGYGSHAAAQVAGHLVADDDKVAEAMARYQASPSEGRTMLAGILGIERDRSLETAGSTFCAAVVKMRGMDSLNKVWDAPDNLPTMDEIKDPFAWMERVLVDE
jgi:putative hydrolase